jgi:hypothetical protein
MTERASTISPKDLLLSTMRIAWVAGNQLSNEAEKVVKEADKLPQGIERQAVPPRLVYYSSQPLGTYSRPTSLQINQKYQTTLCGLALQLWTRPAGRRTASQSIALRRRARRPGPIDFDPSSPSNAHHRAYQGGLDTERGHLRSSRKTRKPNGLDRTGRTRR